MILVNHFVLKFPLFSDKFFLSLTECIFGNYFSEQTTFSGTFWQFFLLFLGIFRFQKLLCFGELFVFLRTFKKLYKLFCFILETKKVYDNFLKLKQFLNEDLSSCKYLGCPQKSVTNFIKLNLIVFKFSQTYIKKS